MEVYIGNYKISTDKYNFMVEEKVTPKRKRSEDGGQPYWVTLSYHPTLDFACRKLLSCAIKDTDASDIQGLIDSVEKNTEHISSIIKNIKEVPHLMSPK
mgnify:FL=1